MLLSRKRDSNFYNILSNLVDRYSKKRFSYSLDSSYDDTIKLKIYFEYPYHYGDTTIFYKGSCHVLVKLSNTHLVNKNTMVFGVSFSFSHILIDVDDMVKDLWEQIIGINLGVEPKNLTLKDLRNHIVNTVPSYDDTSGIVKNYYEYKGLPKWLDTSDFIPFLVWNTDGYRVKMVTDRGHCTKWYDLGDSYRSRSGYVDMDPPFRIKVSLPNFELMF